VSWEVKLLPEVEEHDLPTIEKNLRNLLKSKTLTAEVYQAVKEEIVGRIGQLLNGPNHPEAMKEPLPPGVSSSFDFRKIRFRFRISELRKRRKRDINLCRIPYVVFEESATIVVVFIYTHAEYSKRPSDRELKSRLKRAARFRQT